MVEVYFLTILRWIFQKKMTQLFNLLQQNKNITKV